MKFENLKLGNCRRLATLCGLLWFTVISPAHAYFDPGTSSLILQAIVGLFAAGSVLVGTYWRRLKGFFDKSTGPKDRDNNNEN